MSYDLDRVKDTISEHPVEIIAAVTAVGVIGAVCYNNKKQREHEIALAKLQAKAMRPPWWTLFVRRDHRSKNTNLAA